MSREEMIRDTLSYIEENLLTDITASELAERAGYNLFHFYRLFYVEMGIPIMHYIQHRRLLHAIFEIAEGEKQINAALRYGYETYAGFYRAFIREFGYAPAHFLQLYPVRRPHMVNIFKEEHKMKDHKQISKLLEHWGMEEEKVTNVYHAGTGDQHTCVFSIGKNHILKCTRDVQTIYREKKFSDKLRKAGISCAQIVVTRDGCDFIEEGDDRYYMVTRLDGDTLRSQTLIESREDALYLGEMIAQLHGVLSQMDAETQTVDFLHTLENWAIPRAKAVLSEKQGELDVFMKKFAKLYPQLPQQLIHRDPNPSNIIRSENGWSFIDFELSQKNIRIYDPCYAATAILSERFGRDHEKWFSTYHAILDGYDIVAKLTDAEKEAVPYVTIANQIVCIAWFSEEERYRELLQINREMTIWLIDHFENMKRE